MTAWLAPIGLLFVSNIFMTFAWYGQLGAVSRPIWLAVLIACGVLLAFARTIPVTEKQSAERGRVTR